MLCIQLAARPRFTFKRARFIQSVQTDSNGNNNNRPAQQQARVSARPIVQT